jgi:hypothetical protein
MEVVEPFLALVIYPTTAEAQTRQADNMARVAAEGLRPHAGFLHPKAYWLRPHANVEAP